jgi:acyl-coenzyme A synthetase/AMP-(fatty) acid ligase
LTDVALRSDKAHALVAQVGGASKNQADFQDDVRTWAKELASQPGQRWALYTDDAYEFATALLGAWQADKVVVLPGDAQAHTLERLRGQVDGLLGSMPGGLRPLSAAPNRDWRLRRLDLKAHRLVVHTSGSSGEPLSIDKTLGQLEAEVRALESEFGAALRVPGLRVHATVSHQHIYGLLFLVLWPLAAGRTFTSRRLDYPEAMLASMTDGPCALVCSPAHLRRLPSHLDWAPARRNLSAVFSSGGPLPPDASHQAWRVLGQSPIEVYGSSETGGIAWRQRAHHAELWVPFADVAINVIDGMLEVRSPKLPDDKPWLTSDLVELHADGRFELKGRTDRIVKIEEKRVSLSAMERTLLACAEVAEARVLVIQESDRQRLAVVVVPTPEGQSVLASEGRRGLSERLRQALLMEVERVALPRRWRFVDALPTNAQSKVTDALLAALFTKQMPSPRWVEQGSASADAWLDISPDLAVFDGHFPQAPLLPGVAQLDWAIQWGRDCFGLHGGFLRVEVLKFQLAVRPGDLLHVMLSWDAARNTLGFVYESAKGRHASGRVILKEAASV